MKSQTSLVVYSDWHMGMPGDPKAVLEWFNEVMCEGRDYEIVLSAGDSWPRWRTVDMTKLVYKQIRDERILAWKLGPHRSRVGWKKRKRKGRYARH